MVDLLYKWPVAAKFGSRVPKEKFYEYGNVSTSVREKFVSEIQRITWAYKLAESTINLPGSTSVPEIQVFHIDTKTGDVADQVLSAIDKAIQYPIIFEIARATAGERQVRMVAAHKQLGSGASKLSAYYSTGWLPADVERQSLPTAIGLTTLYAALGYPSEPTRVVWCRSVIRGVGSTTRVRWVSFSHGLLRTLIVWTIWSGCVGRTGSSARDVRMPGVGGSRTAVSSAHGVRRRRR